MPTPGLGRSVILGGQGIYVRLTSSGTAYDAATQVFSSNVSRWRTSRYSR